MNIHIPSLIAGSIIGAILSGLTIVVLTAILHSDDRNVLDRAVAECRKDAPLYIQRAGQLLSVRCNGHKEGQ